MSRSGTAVQIKATQGGSVGLRAEPDHLLVLVIARDGSTVEVFNGPGALAWSAAGAMQKNGQRPISVSKLRSLMSTVPSEARLPTVVPGA